MQLSFLVHPDKNRDDSERAQKAFEGKNNKPLDLVGIILPLLELNLLKRYFIT